MSLSIYVDIHSLDSRPIQLTCIDPTSVPVLTDCGMLPKFHPSKPGIACHNTDSCTIFLPSVTERRQRQLWQGCHPHHRVLTLCPAIFRRQHWFPRFCWTPSGAWLSEPSKSVGDERWATSYGVWKNVTSIRWRRTQAIRESTSKAG